MPATSQIHPTAIVSDQAVLHPSVEIGPHCVIEGPVTLAAGVRVIAQAYLRGPLTIGRNTVIWPGACLGSPPQDYKVGPDDTSAGVVIGEDCIIREHATVHAATNNDTPTTLGNKVFLMVQSHIGHDCTVDDEVILINNACLAGHVHAAHKATVSGGSVVHQFCRLGRISFISGGLGVSGDVPPFMAVHDRQRLGGVNLVGMRRSGIPREEITAVRQAFRECFWKPITRDDQLARLDELGADFPAVAELAEFVRTATRHILPGSGRSRSKSDS